MAATPKNGQLTFVGAVTGRTYVKEIYCSDVDKALANFDSGVGASATSETFFTPPEPMYLIDAAIVTGMADTVKIQMTRNGVPTGDVLRYGPFTDSVATRPRLSIPFNAGDKVAAIQLA